MRWASFVILAFALGIGQFAYADSRADSRADSIDRRADELASSKSYKMRLSAAAWLATKTDARAVEAMARALDRDPEKGIRQLAAKALSRQISARTPAAVRNRAFTVLQRAAKKDSDRKVRRRARRALKKLASLRTTTPRHSRGGSFAASRSRATNGIFVHIGKPNLGKYRAPRGTTASLQQAVIAKLRASLSSKYVKMGSHRSALPTHAELQRDKRRGWYVGATVARLDVRRRGSTAVVKCSVSMRVNPWFGKDAQQKLIAHETASATGNAEVKAQNTREQINLAKQDCLLAVAEQITGSRVVPFLKQRSPVARRSSANHGVRVSRSRR